MPTVSVPEETFRKLAERAAAINLSVDELVQPALEQLATSPSPAPPSLPLTGEAWLKELAAWRKDAEAIASRYPPDFVLDDSRETSYREREDAQL